MHENRLWPPPAGRWKLAMNWHDLLFAHWPVPFEQLRPLIPPCLELETHEGWAWLGIVPFRMSNVRPRWLPPIPWMSAFPELNVRTYVAAEGKPGVWFFSLDATNRIAVRAARRWYHLRYYDARISLTTDQEGWLQYRSRRVHPGAPSAELAMRYRPTGQVYNSRPGSFDYWLTERHCLYAADHRNVCFRGEIDHAPWPLQPAEAEVQINRMTEPLGVPLPAVPPVLHFARRIEVVAWGLERIGG